MTKRSKYHPISERTAHELKDRLMERVRKVALEPGDRTHARHGTHIIYGKVGFHDLSTLKDRALKVAFVKVDCRPGGKTRKRCFANKGGTAFITPFAGKSAEGVFYFIGKFVL